MINYKDSKMLTLLSPAKKLDLEPVEIPIPPTQPVLQKDTTELVRCLKTKSAADLKALMKLSDPLAELNAQRFKAFTLNGRSNSAKPALFTFNGNVYEGLDPKNLDVGDLTYAQDHLRILSGLYGVLKPLDSIQPYRLEMGSRLETDRGKNLYQFWGTKLADILKSDVQAHTDKTILNLASNEYFKAIDQKALGLPVLSAKFLNVKDGKARNLMYYAKRARGLMARWVCQNQIDRADDLRGFDLENYQIDMAQSSEHELVFARQQPPPKS